MSRIRSRGNADTELALVRVFRANGITGWRRHLKLRVGELRVEGRKKSTSPRPSPQRGEGGDFCVRPDFVFPKLRLAVFVDGCFWHGCPEHATWPKNNADFWRSKIVANQQRDLDTGERLRADGWEVVRVWAHETPDEAAARIEDVVRSRRSPKGSA